MPGIPKPSPPHQQKMIVYIDGFNLYHGLHSKFGRKYLWLDLIKLAQSLRPGQRLLTVKYFTANVLNDPNAQSRQDHYIEALRALYGTELEVVLGRYQQKKSTCLQCGYEYTLYEEKQTDVNIATSLVVDASQQQFDTAIIISGDSDLAPAVRAAQALHPSSFVIAAFPPQRVSNELKTLMPSSFVISEQKVRQAQLSSSFTVKGRNFDKPSKWS